MSQISIPVSISQLFVTEIYRTDLTHPGFAPLIDELEVASRRIAAEDKAGQNWAQSHAYSGYTSYESISDLMPRDPSFSHLVTMIDRHVATFADNLNYDLRSKPLKLTALWINILNPQGTHGNHFHPNSVISGTFYLALPPGSSALKFEDPRLLSMMNMPPRKPDAPVIRQSSVAMIPQRGTLLLWESWLRHEVPVNQSDDVRISLSFNYN